MLFKARERREELRSSTYLEIILIVVIILTLLVFDKNIRLRNIDNEYKNKEIELKKEITVLKSENRNLKSQIKELKDEIVYLEKLVSTKDGASKGLMSKNSQLREEIRKLKNKIRDLEDMLRKKDNKLIQENIRLKAQIKQLEEELRKYAGPEKGGVKERGRCRLTSDNKLTNVSSNVEVGAFISIVKVQDSFELEVNDNFIFEKLLVAVPELKILESKSIFSIKEFKNFGSKLLSKANKNNCYLLAKVKKNSINLQDLDLIEKYFYKSYY